MSQHNLLCLQGHYILLLIRSGVVDARERERESEKEKNEQFARGEAETDDEGVRERGVRVNG